MLKPEIIREPAVAKLYGVTLPNDLIQPKGLPDRLLAAWSALAQLTAEDRRYVWRLFDLVRFDPVNIAIFGINPPADTQTI